MTPSDPLRKWLQESRYMVCGCQSCMHHASKASPIETMMHNAFGMRWENYVCSDLWQLHCQWPVLGYRADFAVITPEIRIVVECDGHDFHERTKEQAARDRKRDRAMAADGWTVLRFTGSEIWQNPFACVDQVGEIAMAADIAAERARRSA